MNITRNPDGSETVALHEFVHKGEVASAFIRGGVADADTGIKCPACGRLAPTIDQCRSHHCECGVWMSVAGNGLTMSRKQRDGFPVMDVTA